MRITKIEISNLIGIEQLDFSPGAITEIAGENEEGKSSVIAAIMELIGGGQDVTVLRRGAEKGMAAIMIESQAGDIQIEKTWTEKSPGTLRIERDGRAIARPQEYLRSLFSRLVNPIDFLTAKPELRATWLLQALPLKVTGEELAAAAGLAPAYEIRPPGQKIGPLTPMQAADRHALVAIDFVRAEIYERRRAAHVAGDEKQATAEQIASTLPGGEPDDLSGKIDDLGRKLTDIKAQIMSARRVAEAALETEEGAADNEFLRAKGAAFTECEEIYRKANEMIRNAEAERARKVTEARAISDRRVASARADKDAVLDSQTADLRDLERQYSVELAEARAQQAAADRTNTQRDLVKTYRAAAIEKYNEQLRQQKFLDSLDALRARLLEQLPIERLTYEDGEFYLGGIHINRLNTATQIRLAIKAAELTAGKVGVICIDGLERLDARRRQELYEECKATGLQYIVTRVTDEPGLRVTTIA